MRCFAIIAALSLVVRADLVVDLEALAEGSFKDVEALKAIQWNPHCTGNFTCADPYEAYRGMPSLTMMSGSCAYVRVGGDGQPFGALYSSTEEEHVQAIFVKDGEAGAFKKNADGMEKQVFALTSGSVFGESALQGANSKRQATVKATTAVTMLKLTRAKCAAPHLPRASPATRQPWRLGPAAST